MIRAAKAVDRDQVIALLREGFSRSRYKDKGEVSEKHARELVLGMILKHGLPALDGTHCMVGEQGGRMVGLLFGAKQRIYLIGSKFEATALFYYVQPGHPFISAALLRSFIEWAAVDPRVIEIREGATDAVNDFRAAGRLYESAGFTKCGEMWRRAA